MYYIDFIFNWNAPQLSRPLVLKKSSLQVALSYSLSSYLHYLPCDQCIIRLQQVFVELYATAEVLDTKAHTFEFWRLEAIVHTWMGN